MERSTLIDPELGREALAFVAPLLDRAVTDSAVGQSGVLYIVVMNPAREKVASSFEDAILFEHSRGKPRDAWDADYAEYARKKAQVSWETGLGSGDARTQAAWRSKGQASPLAGGVVIDGIVVAASGAEAVYDEVLAGSIALALRAAIRRRAGERS